MASNAPKFPRLCALEKILNLPMLLLCFVWLCILIDELVYGTSPTLSGFGTGIWILFILYFTLRLVTIANHIAFLKRNWLFVLAIIVSMLRFFPILHHLPLVRALTATFGIQVVWIFASAALGMNSLRLALGRRGAGYALALTFVVIAAGAAGMLHFEGLSAEKSMFHTYPQALWWTAMQMTNIGASASIRTMGGRMLCLCISVYAAAMFGYLTALIATFFIDREVKDQKPEIANQKTVQEDTQRNIAITPYHRRHGEPSGKHN